MTAATANPETSSPSKNWTWSSAMANAAFMSA
jgi:hypothetical protein